jgi:hypothetical protein
MVSAKCLCQMLISCHTRNSPNTVKSTCIVFPLIFHFCSPRITPSVLPVCSGICVAVHPVQKFHTTISTFPACRALSQFAVAISMTVNTKPKYGFPVINNNLIIHKGLSCHVFWVVFPTYQHLTFPLIVPLVGTTMSMQGGWCCNNTRCTSLANVGSLNIKKGSWVLRWKLVMRGRQE